MKRTMMVFMAVATLALAAGTAFAHPVGARIDRRQARQHARIEQGCRRGDLTRAERRHLRAGQRNVRRMEWRAEADGRLDPRERWRIHRALDRQSRAIYRLRHNGRTV